METKKIVLITGAGTGIGKASAELFAQKGWQVIAGVRDPQRYCTAFTQPNVQCQALDVTNEASTAAALEQITKTYGHIDAVVNNAGYGLFGAFEQLTPIEIEQQYAVNVFGVMNVCRAVLPLLRRQRAGTIVNISSMGGKFVIPYYGIYNSTKFAVEGFSEGLFYELLPFGVRVKMVEPGAVHTDFYTRSKKIGTRAVDTAVYKKMADKLWEQYHAAGRGGLQPEQVARVVYKAATSRSRRLRYAAGGAGRFNVLLFKFLPHQWAMRLAQMTTLDRVQL